MHFPRIHDLRVYSGSKQKDIAEYLECDRRTYYLYEQGRLEIPTKRLIKLAQFYNVSCDYILGLKDSPGNYVGISRVPLGIRLKKLRLKKGYSEEFLAKYLYCGQSNYSHYETSRRYMPVDMLIRLSKLYHVSVDYLLFGVGEDDPYLLSLT